MRILRLLDCETIYGIHIFAGFSDITAMHIFLNEKCRIVTFHAPMPAADHEAMDCFTLGSLKNHIFGQPHCNPSTILPAFQ